MSILFPRCYQLLLLVEHTPEDAARILLDARRGDGYALVYLRTLAQLCRLKASMDALLENLLLEV